MYKKILFSIVCLFIARVQAAEDNALFMEAFRTGDIERVNSLIRSGKNVNATNEWNETPTHYAVGFVASPEKSISVLRSLVSAGAHIDRPTTYKFTPLHVASQLGRIEAADFLIHSGANINATTDKRETPLHLAVEKNHPMIVKLLLDAGADARLRNNDCKVPKELATTSEVRDLFEPHKKKCGCC